MKKIRRALISIYKKDKIEDLLVVLKQNNVDILSTGGTYEYIKSSGLYYSLTKVEDITGYPSILGGRVKTLHPKIFGGILGRSEIDYNEINEYDIPEIDLVLVDLYPFKETVKSNAPETDIIEKIDIGGISLIRAAAKNYKDVIIIPSFEYVDKLTEVLKYNDGCTTLTYRKRMAAKAFEISSRYDTDIRNYFESVQEETPAVEKDSLITNFNIKIDDCLALRYGENPHQRGYFCGDLNQVFTQLHGKEISYNNLVDIDAGIRLINEFEDPTVVIMKHTNPCGLAVRKDISDAWDSALAGDPVSAFGGVIFFNRPFTDIKLAQKVNNLFFEVLLAQDFSDDVLEVLKSKKNRILLKSNNLNLKSIMYKSILNGTLLQDYDNLKVDYNELKCVTNEVATDEELKNMIFANLIVKHTKSNAIVLVKDMQLIGSGAGQTSRIDALKNAIDKAKSFNFDLTGAVMASDAFFPFADSVELAYNEGIMSIIQPGGSIRDNESIEFCNNNKMKMVFTGHRHFKH